MATKIKRKRIVKSENEMISERVGISVDAVQFIRSGYFNGFLKKSLKDNISLLQDRIDHFEKNLKTHKEVLAFMENAELERIEEVIKR